MAMQHPLIYLILFAIFGFYKSAQAVQKRKDKISFKPRIINTTDLGADPDDEQSMVRQLVCANEFDI